MKLRVLFVALVAGAGLVAACSAFSKGDDEAGASSSGSSSSGSTSSGGTTDGGGAGGGDDGAVPTDGGNTPPDATVTVPDGGGTCTVLFDDFETTTNYWVSFASGGAAQTRANVSPPADAGMYAARFLTSANTQTAYLRRALDNGPPPPCGTILLDAWFYPASTLNRPTILQIDRKHLVTSAPIPSIKLVVQAANVDVIAGTDTLASPSLGPGVWHRIRLEYSRALGKLRVSIDANPFDSFDLTSGNPTLLTYGVLAGTPGNDDLYFDDVTLRY